MMSKIQETAENHDWEACIYFASVHIQYLRPRDAGELCLNYFHIYLPRYAVLSDNVNWVLLRLGEIQQTKLFLADGIDLPLFTDINLFFPTPRERTIKRAVFAFWRAARWQHIPQVRATDLTEAIAIFIASMCRDFPEWIPEKYDSEGVRDMKSIDYWAFLWTALSDELMTPTSPA